MQLSFNDILSLKKGDEIVEMHHGQQSKSKLLTDVLVADVTIGDRTTRQIAFITMNEASLSTYLFTESMMHYCPTIIKA